uniref:Uncharacterized protein n=1 Tax=viral metagenome TaxID=1070528 RepID=A0A6M3J9B5_9ZZZZ
MSETNLTAEELETKILRQLKEDTSGSEAFPSELIYDTMNEIYEEVFNQPNKQVNVRTDEYEFTVVEDTTLDGDLTAGDTSIVLADSSSFPSSGRILIENELVDYTANDGATTLTCSASAVSVDHSDGKTVRCCYALPSEIDKEKAQYLNINGLPYNIADVAQILDENIDHYRMYAIYEGYIMLPKGEDAYGAIFIYTPALTRMTTGADIPSLIPNNMRVALIVNGSVGKLMILDGQSGAEYYYRPPQNQRDKGAGQFYDALRKFYATYGRHTDIRGKKTKGSIYD